MGEINLKMWNSRDKRNSEEILAVLWLLTQLLCWFLSKTLMPDYFCDCHIGNMGRPNLSFTL